MKKDKACLLTTLTLILLNAFLFSYAQDTSGSLKELDRAKSIRLIIDESYSGSKDVSLPFEEILARIFHETGIRLVREPKAEADATLKIKARGWPLTARYSWSLFAKEGALRYSGAELKISVAYKSDKQKFSKELQGRINSPESIRQFSYLTPDDAPYGTALYETNMENFLLEEFRKIYVFEFLSPELKSKDIAIRQKAAEGLAKLNNPRVKSLMMECLDDSELSVINIAVKYLMSGNTSDMLNLLISHKNSFVRQSIIEQITEIPSLSRNPRVSPFLVESLRDSDPGVVSTAVRCLLSGNDPDIIGILVKHKSDFVRLSTVRRLGNMKTTGQVDIFLNTLKDSSWEVRAAAAGFLRGTQAIIPLMEALRDDNSLVIEKASKSVYEIGLKIAAGQDSISDSNTIDYLNRATHDQSEIIRDHAALLLGKGIAAPISLGRIISSFFYDKEWTKNSIAEFIKSLHEIYVGLNIKQKIPTDYRSVQLNFYETYADSYNYQAYVSSLLAKLAPYSTPFLLTILKDESYRNGRKAWAIMALGKIKEKSALVPLLNLFQKSDVDIRTQVAFALGELGAPESVVPLIKDVQDQDSKSRWASAEALGKIRDPRAIEPLIFLLRSKYYGDRRQAIIALNHFRTPKVLDALTLVYQKDESKEIRAEAAGALWDMKNDMEFLIFLLDSLKDNDWGARRTSAKALGRINDPKSIAALKNALQDQEYGVQSAAAGALEKLGYSSAEWPPIVLLMVQDKWEEIAEMGKLAVGPLIDSLKFRKRFFETKWFNSYRIINLLNQFTGVNFEKDYDLWSKWWEENKKNFLK